MILHITLLKKILIIFFSLLILIYPTKSILADNILIKIEGNNFTDENVIKSFIDKPPTDLTKEYSDYLLKILDNSKLFKNVSVEILDNSFVIYVVEYPNINDVNFINNERLKNEDLMGIFNQMNIANINPVELEKYEKEISSIYKSFGYNNIYITKEITLNSNSNTADLNYTFNEGKITKIKNIFFDGNLSFTNQELLSKIKSKTKTITNIFANNNYKDSVVKRDIQRLSKLYINSGYKKVNINHKIEFFGDNKVNIYFNIKEGDLFKISNIEFSDENNLLSLEDKDELIKKINTEFSNLEIYSPEKINDIKEFISDNITDYGINFYEIEALEKNVNLTTDVLFRLRAVEPKYTKLININGNTRTFDYVIRRELELTEGDAFNDFQMRSIEKKLRSLNLFKSVTVEEKKIDKNLSDININVEEQQTGSLNAGLSVGSLTGFSVVAGLKERNFGGTGRSLNFLINTSSDKNQYTFETTDRIFYENNVDIKYSANYIEDDLSSSNSYKLNTTSFGGGIGFNINKLLRHNINLNYLLKEYIITNKSTVSSEIAKSSGANASFILGNTLSFSTLNSFYIPLNGKFFRFINTVETPTSSSNGYVKNVLTYKNYKKYNKNVLSAQVRVGNISSLGNNDILTDDKFSLGGRWLRGFDNYGAGPRKSRTSYIGGENLFVSKLDYSRELFEGSDTPFYLNVFNDYGLVWQNKTKPTFNDNNLRSSVGFGFKYYSAIGPIGFSWGFPIMDEEYDIKRMFLFSLGNIN